MDKPRERTTIERPIATRDLQARDADGKMHDVRILVSAPEPIAGAEDHVCFYQILGVGAGRVGKTYGVDSAQALIHALNAVGIELAVHRRHRGLKLWWLEEGDEDLGFPLPATSPEPCATG